MVKLRRRVDLLQYEHDHGRLSPLALAAGRGIEAALEGVSRSPPTPLRHRVDSSPRPDEAGLHAIEAARRARVAMNRVEAAVGPVDARIIERVLGGRLTFEDIAQAEGRAGARGVSYYATRFRDALEELCRMTYTIGAVVHSTDDKYACAAARLDQQTG